MGVEDVPRVDDVALALAHLAAVFGQDVAQADDVLVGRAVEEQRAHRVQRVEPAARLVDGLTDVVGLFLALPDFLVGKGIVPLGDRHRTGVVPGVGHFFDAAHRPAVGRGPGQIVHVGAVQVRVLQFAPDLCLQLGHAADALGVAAAGRVALPDGQRRAPVAVAAQRPVHVVLQPVAEAPVFDVLRVPVDRLVDRNQAVAILAGADVPGLLGHVEQRRIAAPAEGVGVLIRTRLVEQAAARQFRLDRRVRGLDEDAGPGRHLRLERAVEAHGHQHGQAMLLAHLHVVGAEGRRDVDDATAVFGAHEVAGHHVGVILLHRVEGVERLVVDARQVAALHAVEHGVAGTQHALGQVGGQRQHVAAHVAHAHVVQVRAHGQRHVARQRPRRGRPGKEVLIVAPRPFG